MVQILRFLHEYREAVAFLAFVGASVIGFHMGRVVERDEWRRREAARMRHKYGR